MSKQCWYFIHLQGLGSSQLADHLDFARFRSMSLGLTPVAIRVTVEDLRLLVICRRKVAWKGYIEIVSYVSITLVFCPSTLLFKILTLLTFRTHKTQPRDTYIHIYMVNIHIYRVEVSEQIRLILSYFLRVLTTLYLLTVYKRDNL